MDKIKIYIDFEAISSPFNRGFGATVEWPYAYTIGTFKGKQFKTLTYVMDFRWLKTKIKQSQIETNHIFEEMQRNLKNDLSSLLETKNLNVKDINFIAWSGVLERMILKNIFGDEILVTDQNSSNQLSLKLITSAEIRTDKYFENFRATAIKNIQPKFYKSRGLEHDGALAALAGYILLHTQTKRTGKFFFEMNEKVLLDEIKAYSLDDVLRMALIEEKGPEWMKQKSELNMDRNNKIMRLSKLVGRNNKLLGDLRNYDSEMTLKALIEILTEENNKHTSAIKEIKDKEIKK